MRHVCSATLSWRPLESQLCRISYFSFSANGIIYNVGSATADIDLSKKIILEHSNYEFAFFYDKECSMPVGDLNEATFSLEHGDNVYFMQVYDNGKNVLYSYKFNVYRQMQYTVTFIGLNGEKLGTVGVDDGDTLSEAYDLTVTGYTVKWKNESGVDFARPFIKYTPTWSRSFTPSSQKERNKIAVSPSFSGGGNSKNFSKPLFSDLFRE